jgi:hypothetical protein
MSALDVLLPQLPRCPRACRVSTLGDFVLEATRRAKLQIAPPPIIDLPVLYGPGIS